METFSVLLAICAGNSPVTGEIPAQRSVTRSFGVFFDLHLNKRLSKQSWGWWFETPSHPLWRQCNDYKISSNMSSSYVYELNRDWIFLENIHAISVIWVRWPNICSLCQGFSFRIIKYRTLANRMSNYNVFIASSFNYFNVVWHFCSNRSLYRLEKLHKQGRRVFLNDYASHCLNIWIQMKNARQM